MEHSATSGLRLNRSHLILLSILALLCLPEWASAANEDVADRQLLVRLAPEPMAPAPATLVAAIRAGKPLDEALAPGSPIDVAYVITQRVTGAARTELLAAPERPRARLQRWILLTYPTATDLATVERSLRADPRIEVVERNLRAAFSAVTPNDPLFPQQWGSFSLNLPEAWERTKGHGYVGLIDTGLDVDHPDLAMTFDSLEFKGGNFRPHLSNDFAFPSTCATNPGCVDEDEVGDPTGFNGQGHGTHTSGIIGATADNGTGTTGNCWNCGIMMARSTVTTAQVANALRWLADHGAQAVSMSFGWPTTQTVIADAIDDVNERDLILVAAVGNDLQNIEFPAFDDAVIAAGGTEEPLPPTTVDFWERDICPSAMGPLPGCGSTATYSGTTECGSNYTVTTGSPMIELVAPAADVLSTFYVGGCWNDGLGCHDGGHPAVGYDYCTGTSMSSPHIASVATLVRSVNPLLAQADVRAILKKTASGGGAWDPQLGYGTPDTAGAVDSILGSAAGQTLANRLTPLFVLKSFTANAHLETTVPQRASAALLDPGTPYSGFSGLAPAVGGYTQYPGAVCTIGPCTTVPVAWAYLFSTDQEPFPGAPELVPLYRLSYDEPWNGNADNQSFAYTTETIGVKRFNDVGYRLDGIEGYIYKRCTPEPSCIPAGATRLYRLYNLTLDDYVVIPESQVATFQAQGYTFQPGLNDWIGYVYENLDADGDHLIDGFEVLVGTGTADPDSDDDGLTDGEEILDFPYSDPLDSPICDTVFADSFDSGSTSSWSQVITTGSGQVGVNAKSAIVGPFGMFDQIGAAGDRAFVRDNSPASETFYRASFHLKLADVRFADGNQHNILVVRDDNPSQWVILIAMRRSGTSYQLRARTRLDNGTVVNTTWINFSSTLVRQTPHHVELVWDAADPGQSNGSLIFSINTQSTIGGALLALDNDSYQIDQARFGMVGGIDAGTEGLFVFDDFESCRN